ncbi:MAG: VWA domain-containing protein [Acidobacteriota bacterium]
MGQGSYSHDAHQALLKGRKNLPVQKVFRQQQCHPLMNPKGVKVRECRDSAEHPHSLGIAFALDVTGSMGDIPHLLATQQLPSFMKVLMDCDIPDPQLLFTAVGDATSDQAPLQVGQFESTAELMDQWLTRSFLEGGGGGSGEESYELALYFLALHTEMDCVIKRKKKGYLFITGDERPYPTLSRHIVDTIVGDRLDEDLKVEEVLAEVQKSFVPFFVIPDDVRRYRQHCERAWRDLLGDHVICLESPQDVCFATAGAILLSEGLVRNLDELSQKLLAAGMDETRKAAVVKALKPLILSEKKLKIPFLR